jgi:hypothetical protein
VSAPGRPERGDVIIHGTSFGFCAGYCTFVLEVDGATARLTETGREVLGTTIRTTYEFGHDLDPIAELQAELRSLRQRILTAGL